MAERSAADDGAYGVSFRDAGGFIVREIDTAGAKHADTALWSSGVVATSAENGSRKESGIEYDIVVGNGS